ncbi:MAG: GNVR domain-containing protein, partial [Deltaproteobacteria bacterium]
GFLPEQMQNNYSILTRLQQQLDSTNNTLQKTEDRKILLQGQLNKLESIQQSASQAGGKETTPPTLEQMRQELQVLKSRYSDKHPDVVKLTATISKMEKEEQSGTGEKDSSGPSPASSTSQADRLMMVQKEDAVAELKMINGEIQSLRRDLEKTTEQIKNYQQRIESGPKIEAMYVDLRRDYERANENYQSLLQKKLEAELAENLERTQKGEQFTILDAANLPDKPSKPNIIKVLAMGFMLAIACGFGLAFLREYLDPTFWSRKEVESTLDMPILVSIPIIATERERRLKKIKLAASVCVLLVMSSTLLYALFILWKKNPTLIPL